MAFRTGTALQSAKRDVVCRARWRGPAASAPRRREFSGSKTQLLNLINALKIE